MQHRKRTKVTAALLALCMLVSLLPVTAFGLDPQSAELGKGSTIDGTGYHVTSVKNYSIAPDISERVIITTLSKGDYFAEALCCAGVKESPVSVVATESQ